MAAQLGGAVEAGKVREFGYAEVRARGHSALFREIQDRPNAEGHGLLDVWMSHGDKVTALPPGFTQIGSSQACAIAAMADESRRFYAVQFHPGGHAHEAGRGAARALRPRHLRLRRRLEHARLRAEAVAAIRAQSGDEEVLLGLSGGVDSSVAAALIHRAIGDAADLRVRRPRAPPAERGRAGDAHLRAEPRRASVIHVDASARFLQALAGVTDPEEKRRIIGRLFVDVFQREAAKLANVRWLAQGTIYPDVIESAGAEDQEGAHDQVAPQRRRAAGHAASQVAGAAARALQGRSARAWTGARPAARHGAPSPVPRTRPRRPHTRRGDARAGRPPASRGRDLHRRASDGARRRRQVVVRQDGAGVRGLSAGAIGGGDGRRPDLREHGRRCARWKPPTS